jgi:hypothetical protein
MGADHAAGVEARLRVRVNVTCTGTLVALDEASAIVELPRPQPPHRQTTLAIEGVDGHTLYIPVRVVRTERATESTTLNPVHYVFVEFLEPLRRTPTAVRMLLRETETVCQKRTALYPRRARV